jgi:hypothetical protein
MQKLQKKDNQNSSGDEKMPPATLDGRSMCGSIEVMMPLHAVQPLALGLALSSAAAELGKPVLTAKQHSAHPPPPPPAANEPNPAHTL